MLLIVEERVGLSIEPDSGGTSALADLRSGDGRASQEGDNGGNGKLHCG